MNIKYIIEDKPLGTAGALSLVKSESPHLIVTNCDIITDLSYSNLLHFSRKYNVIAAMAVYNFETGIDFGVVDVDGFKITGFKAKLSHFVNSGLLPKQDALRFIKYNTFLDMPTLFEALDRAGNETYAMPMFESWIDVGRHKDLEKLQS